MNKKRPVYIIFMILILLLSPFIFNLISILTLRQDLVAKDISIIFFASDVDTKENVQIKASRPFAKDVNFNCYPARYSDTSPQQWMLKKSQLVDSITVTMSDSFFDSIDCIQLDKGGDTQFFKIKQLRYLKDKASQIPGIITISLPVKQAVNSKFPIFNRTMNWKGDENFFRLFTNTPVDAINIIIIITIICGTGLLLYLFKFLRSFANCLLVNNDAHDEIQWKWPGEIPWITGGLLMVTAIFIWIEYTWPFYFVQDDNYSQFLPVIIQGCKFFPRSGLPVWNPFQFLGVATATFGVYSLTYPITYLSCFLAGSLLGNYYLTIEVFAFLHFLPAYVACYWFLRLNSVKRAVAAASSLAFVFSGYSLIAGRSWYYTIPVLLFLPLLSGLASLLINKPVTIRWIVVTGLTIGLFFHSGNAQNWVYGVGLFVLVILLEVITGNVHLSRAVKTIPALLLGFAIAAPLLVPQLIRLSPWDRGSGPSQGIGTLGVIGTILPYPILVAPHPNGYGNIHYERMTQFYQTSPLLAITGLIALILITAAVLAFRFNGDVKEMARSNIWLFPAGLCLLAALGDKGFIWNLMSVCPGFSRFQYPFKFIPFFNLFLIASSAIIISRFITNRNNSRLWTTAAVLLITIPLLYNVPLMNTSFYTYHDSPYPPLQKALNPLKANHSSTPGRVIGLGPERICTRRYTWSMVHNFPTFYGIMAIGGYDPMIHSNIIHDRITGHMNPPEINGLRDYGVRWVLVYKPEATGSLTTKPRLRQLEQSYTSSFKRRARAITNHCILRRETPEFYLWEIPDCRPLAFRRSHPEQALALQADVKGVTVKLPPDGCSDAVVLNFLYWPEFSASQNGRQIKLARDDLGRMLLFPDGSGGRIRVVFQPPWSAGFTWAQLFLAGSMISGYLVFRFSRD